MADDKTLHELGNMLAVIAGQAEFLLHQDSGHRAEVRDSLTAIRDAALRGRDKLRQARGKAANGAPTAPSAPPAVPPLRVTLHRGSQQSPTAVAFARHPSSDVRGGGDAPR